MACPDRGEPDRPAVFRASFATISADCSGTLAARCSIAVAAQVALANFEAAFGDEHTPEDAPKIAREVLSTFHPRHARPFLGPAAERGKISRNTSSTKAWSGARRTSRPSKSCIVGAFHYRNFEWLSLAWAGSVCPARSRLRNSRTHCSTASSNSSANSPGTSTVPRQGAIMKLYKTLRKKGRAALLVDTTLPPHHPTVVIECFGLKTIVTRGARLAAGAHRRAASFPFIANRCPGGRYRIVDASEGAAAKGRDAPGNRAGLLGFL